MVADLLLLTSAERNPIRQNPDRGRTGRDRRSLTCPCSFARREAAAGSIPVDEGAEHLIEEPRRLEAVVVAVAVRQFAQIEIRPHKFIGFTHNDPGWIVIEPKVR